MSPDIESLIAAARERHAPVSIRRLDGSGHDTDCAADGARWPCPDRLLIDALVPVYEAAKDLSRAMQSESATKGPMWDVMPLSVAFAERALRAALGEPNA